MNTHFEQLKNDPRVLKAEQLILEAIHERQNKLHAVQAPKPELISDYTLQLKQLEAFRGAALYYPYLATGFGNGPFVELADGSVKIDMISGIGVHYFGHMSDHYVQAHLDSVLSSTIMQGHLQQQCNSLKLLELILEASNCKGAQLKHGILSSSGAMANENALKLAFSAQPNRPRILAFEKCFHGRTLAMAQVTDKAAYRIGLPQNLAVDYIPFYDAHHPEESSSIALERLKTLLKRYPDSHATMVMELIQGEGGFNTAPRDFFLPILELLRAHGITIWFDEIQTLGRTLEIFAFQEYNFNQYADIVTFGKMSQVCGSLYIESLTPKPGLISQTFTSSTAAIEAAHKTFSVLLKGHLFGVTGIIQQLREVFLTHFHELNQKYPKHFNGPYGHGAMLSFQFADGSMEQSKAFLEALFKAGLIAFLAGQNPVKIRFLPPMGCLKHTHIDQACIILDEVIATFVKAEYL